MKQKEPTTKPLNIDNYLNHFAYFRDRIVGVDAVFESAYGTQKLIYADWIASGRLYHPIEKALLDHFGPMVGNTHSEASETGECMTNAYHKAMQIIKDHVNACEDDVLLNTGTGMTGAIAKLQRILGLKIPEKYARDIKIANEDRPIVFITHMEHHSNQTCWLETIADVEIIPPGESLLVDPNNLIPLLEKYQNRKIKIGSFTACSNVTGISPDYVALTRIMHQHNGLSFVDFAASAPYHSINMNPVDPLDRIDAIFFSPHKFLGGPGSSGVLIFKKHLYHNTVPDIPGGGTVAWTNPWGMHKYFDDIEIREDGGTPGFLQVIKTALCIDLKNSMDVDKIKRRDQFLVNKALDVLNSIEKIFVFAGEEKNRIGSISFYIYDVHHSLVVKLLNDRFGIQVRGGCSCAGTYGHYLFNMSETDSNLITSKINSGDLSGKPGWVRLSIHPTMADDELDFILNAIVAVAENAKSWAIDYKYSSVTNEFSHKYFMSPLSSEIDQWFKLK